ncbi:hypothetical protein CC85DRAFT_303668 [Cutaneotrichosporon oleaginosum]|uniref:Uncharacterized protein n=1 Tax=Cutaneotrichosporon oleaginosum TaxID=879819 RepID=A0A0J1B079_9TREE|nr:uncharacterized protein CC85DRAFT_303668 [Cutaneotrichosporon oleaginosum]KLT40994.1 hypothetical protein CC85DRAFT_303668 [Cutaneotrichosporon oleaginosum]TXT06259.1 hypothetical protein COLE_05590 [Cutaneotrichosporon oleaginosum]
MSYGYRGGYGSFGGGLGGGLGAGGHGTGTSYSSYTFNSRASYGSGISVYSQPSTRRPSLAFPGSYGTTYYNKYEFETHPLLPVGEVSPPSSPTVPVPVPAESSSRAPASPGPTPSRPYTNYTDAYATTSSAHNPYANTYSNEYGADYDPGGSGGSPPERVDRASRPGRGFWAWPMWPRIMPLWFRRRPVVVGQRRPRFCGLF